MLLSLDLPPQPSPSPAALHGPPAPALKRIPPISAPFSLERATRAALRELPGAVVRVEEDAPSFLTQLPPDLKLLHGKLRLFTAEGGPTFTATPAMPVWMDPSVTISGGNVVHRVYALGGGRY